MRSKKILTIFFLLNGLEGAGITALLLAIPADAKHAVLGGLSAVRLGLLIMTLFFSLGFFVLAFACLRSKRAYAAIEAARNWLKNGSRLYFVSLALLALGVLLGLAVNALLAGRFPTWQAAGYRLAPPLVWGSLVCFQFGAVLPLAFFDPSCLLALKTQRGIIMISLFSAAGLIFLWVFLAQTGLGFTIDPVEWVQSPNSPVLFSQVFLTLVILAILLWLSPNLQSWWRTDFLLAGGLWLCAVFLWEVTPYNPSFFSTRPFPPNFETYPYSDGRDYVIIGQTLLIGEGYGNHALVMRPLQALILTAYHVIAGQNYDRVVALQVLVLAFIPVLFYWMGRRVHSRLGGVAAALLLILRERNALLLSGMIPGAHTHVKLFLTEMNTILGMAVLILLLLRWFESPGKHKRTPLVAGGVLGALILVRSQVVVLLPVLAVWMAVRYLRQPRVWLPAVIWFGLGTALFLLPWIGRNYQLAGFLTLEDAPSLHLRYEARYYAGVDTTPLPGERGDDYNARMSGIILDFARRHPSEVLRFVSAHFFHNEVSTTLVFPLQPDSLGLVEYVKDNILWSGGKYRPQVMLDAAMLLLNIAVVGFGVGSAFKRGRGLIMLPVLVRLGYNLSLALARRSGGRYFMAGDWVGLFLFGLGLAELLLWAAALTGGSRLSETFLGKRIESLSAEECPNRVSTRRWLLTAAAVLAAGLVVPAAEWVVPPRYERVTPAQAVGRLQARLPVGEEDERLHLLQGFATQPETQVKWGRGLYPRYFQAGEVLRSYEAFSDVRRLRFEIIGPQPGEVILPGIDLPEYFPNASDVVVFGCQEPEYMDALLVVVLNPAGDHYYWRDPLPPVWGCPLP